MKHELIDEVSFIQMGQTDSEEFERGIFEKSTASTYTRYPTRDNPSRYKINSFWLELSQSMKTIERQTYSLLDWAGDVGGLFDGLKLLASFFVAPIASTALQISLITKGFNIVGNNRQNLSLSAYLPFNLVGSQRRYHKLMKKAKFKVERQLDLIEFLRKERMLLISLLSYYKAPTLAVIRSISSQQVRESDETYSSGA